MKFNVQCAKRFATGSSIRTPLITLGQKVTCGVSLGLIGGGLFVVKAQTLYEEDLVKVSEEKTVKPTTAEVDTKFTPLSNLSPDEHHYSWSRIWSLISPDKGSMLIAIAVSIFTLYH